MGIIARLEYGAARFSLTGGRVELTPEFRLASTAKRYTLGRAQYESRVEDVQYEPQAFRFFVHVIAGSQAAAERELGKLQAFLDQAGNPAKPVYFAFREWGSSFPHEPAWGQFGALTRYKVLFGLVEFGAAYPDEVDHANAWDCPVTLTIDAFDYGLFQTLATAKGWIAEDWAGWNGQALGPRVVGLPAGNENKFANPIFGHGTWNNGWGNGLSLDDRLNNDEHYRLFGYNSAHLTCWDTTDNTFVESVNAGNTNAHVLSCYAKRPDGGVIDATIMQLFYNSAQTTRYVALENGWYFLYVKVAGIASAVDTGVLIAAGGNVYVDGFQLAEGTFPLPLIWGDGQPGASWGGTAHASMTVGPAASGLLTIPAAMRQGHGSVQVAVMCAGRSADLASADYYLLEDASGIFSLYYQKSNNRFVLTLIGTINHAATFEYGDTFIFHVAWGDGTVRLYVNGVLSGSASFAPPSSEAASWLLGSQTTGADQGPWVFLGFDVFEQKMTDADAAEFHTQAAGLLEDGVQRVSPIPYLWTKDGDNVIDNCDDSTRDNWLLASGIGGSAPAETEWEITPAVVNQGVYYLLETRFDVGRFNHPTSIWYQEALGIPDANASGGEYLGMALTTAYNTLNGSITGDDALLEGSLDIFVRMKASGAQDAMVQGLILAGTITEILTEERRVSLTTSYKWFYLGRAYYRFPHQVPDRQKEIYFAFKAKTLTGSVTAHLDFLMAANRGLRLEYSSSNNFGKLSLTENEQAALFNDLLRAPVIAYGDVINLVPDQQQIIWFVQASTAGAHTITNTATFSIRVRPRWVLR